jgi:hypothetical protein
VARQQQQQLNAAQQICIFTSAFTTSATPAQLLSPGLSLRCLLLPLCPSVLLTIHPPPTFWCSHGTHVSGIIGARRNNVRIVGVAPGFPLYGFKVLAANGKGTKSTVLAAFDEVLALLEQGKKIAALNLSFVMTNGQAPPDPLEVQTTCDLLKKISAYGVSTTACAGEADSPCNMLLFVLMARRLVCSACTAGVCSSAAGGPARHVAVHCSFACFCTMCFTSVPIHL